MSIIEETLRALQQKQENKRGDNKIPEAGPGDNNYKYSFDNNRKMLFGKYRTFITIIIVLTLMAFAGFFWMDVYQKSQRKKSAGYPHHEPLLYTDVKISNSDVAELEPEKNKIEKQVLQGKALPVDSWPDIMDNITKHSLASRVVKEVVLDRFTATQYDVPREDYKKDVWDKQDWLAMMEGIQKINIDLIDLPEITKVPETEKKEIETFEPDDDLERNAIETWINNGWLIMNEGDFDKALEIWGTGMFMLPKTKFIIVINVFDTQDSAKNYLLKIGEEHFAFIVKGEYSVKDVFYVISLPPLNTIWTEHDQIVKILGLDKYDSLPSIFLKDNYQGKVSAWIKSGDGIKIKDSGTAMNGMHVQGHIADEAVINSLPDIKNEIKRAKHMINVGSYEKAVNILNPIIENYVATWKVYLLIGTAYLGLNELDKAEKYLDKGLAVTGKQPQLWLQRAVVEQQRGDHGTALQLLKEAQKLAPAMPEVQLNIGYSNDTMGDRLLEAKTAYKLFLDLTEGNSAYFTVRKKVMERLVSLK